MRPLGYATMTLRRNNIRVAVSGLSYNNHNSIYFVSVYVDYIGMCGFTCSRNCDLTVDAKTYMINDFKKSDVYKKTVERLIQEVMETIDMNIKSFIKDIYDGDGIDDLFNQLKVEDVHQS